MVCGNFNTRKYITKRRKSNPLARAMAGFSESMEDKELVDAPLYGGKGSVLYTWTKREEARSFIKKREIFLLC